MHDLALSFAGNGFAEAKDLKLIAQMYSMTSDLLKTNHMKKRAQDVFCHSSGFNFLKNNRICQNRTTEHKTSVRAISGHIKGLFEKCQLNFVEMLVPIRTGDYLVENAPLHF